MYKEQILCVLLVMSFETFPHMWPYVDETEKQWQTRKQKMQANSRSACQFLAQKREGSTEVVRDVAQCPLLQRIEIELMFALSCVYGQQFLRYWLIF